MVKFRLLQLTLPVCRHKSELFVGIMIFWFKRCKISLSLPSTDDSRVRRRGSDTPNNKQKKKLLPFRLSIHRPLLLLLLQHTTHEYHEYIVDHSTNTPPLPLLYLALHAKHPRNRKRRAGKHKSHPVLWSLPQDWKDINDGIVKG